MRKSYIFSDYACRLPNVKFVRQSEKYKKIPLILGSAQLSEKDIPKYINLGADAVLIKPYSTEKLSCTINNLLQ